MKNKTKINLILIIYNLLWYILLPLVLLFYLLRLILKKEDIKRFYERFGYIKKEQLNKKVIWLHAVSLGETMAAVNLATELKKSFPKFSIVISTNTITSANYIIKKSKFIHCYQPLDHPLFVKNFLCFWNPYYAIFLESDYWPNLILGTQNRGIPIFFSSAQISKKAFNRWSKIPSLSKLIFNSPELIFCIDKDQRSNFVKLRKNKIDKNIKIIGSLKISKNKLKCDKYFLSKLKSWSKNYKVILAASIHDIEDQIMGLDNNERETFMKEIGLNKTGLNQLIKEGYDLLNLDTFFTSGPEESRAWTVEKNTLAPKAASVIHTDFEKNFIRAEAVTCEDFIKYGSAEKCKENGKLRI